MSPDHRGSPPGFIAVEGPIGAGKTTLARKLANTFNYDILLEQAGDNPFLARFYQNRREAALATQLFFLFQRSQQLADLRQQDMFQPVRVADFLLQKDRLFAKVNLDEDEYALYERVYDQLLPEAPVPDLVIYLQAPVPVLMQRIRHRGIPAEQNIDSRYLEEINATYSEFFHFFDAAPLLIINAAEIDFANDPRQYEQLVDYLLNIRSGRHYFNPTFFE